jgi:opacity protein-like surface antigen
MNTIKLSAVALLLTSTLAIAGGKLVEAPKSDVIEIPEPALTGFYAGLGYSCLQMDLDVEPGLDVRAMTALSLNAGYNFNQYLAVEGRYTVNVGDLDVETWYSDTEESWDMSNIGLYLKPQYTMGMFTVYGLLGYGQLTLDDGNEYSVDGLQYGAGVNIMATNNMSVYVDYRRLYNEEDFDGLSPNDDVSANSYTLGVNYHF